MSFRYKGRYSGYQALDIEEGFKEGCSLCKPMDNEGDDNESVSKIKDGFAEVFSQFHSIGDISQVSIDFEWNTYIVPLSVIYWSNWMNIWFAVGGIEKGANWNYSNQIEDAILDYLVIIVGYMMQIMSKSDVVVT